MITSLTQLIFSFLIRSESLACGMVPHSMCHVQLNCCYCLSEHNLDDPSQSCLEDSLLSDPRFCQVDSIIHPN